jgi:uncharacterized small protein (DUF1192 family)
LDVDIEPLQIDSHALNTKRILDLMAVKPEEGSVPLYVHTVNRILREMRMSQQATGIRFDYQTFKTQILAADLSPTQLAPLSQRLAMLESFMPRTEENVKKKKKNRQDHIGTTWKNEVRDSCTLAYDTIDADTAWIVNNSRSLLPLRFARDGLLVVQHMLKPVS